MGLKPNENLIKNSINMYNVQCTFELRILFISVSRHVSPSVNLKIKNLYENGNLKKNKPPAEHQGHTCIIYSLKSFAAIQKSRETIPLYKKE